MPYAERTLAPFAKADVEILASRHRVTVATCKSAAQMLATCWRMLGADVLFCWFGSTRYLPAVMTARALGRRVVVVSGGYDVANEPLIGYGNMRGGLTRLLGRLLFRLADRVIPFSRFAALETERNALVDASRIEMLYLGFDPDELGEAVPDEEKEQLVLTVCQLNQSSVVRKGVLTLIDASRLLSHVKVVIAGSADDATRRLLEARAGANVTLCGPVTDQQRNDLYRRSKVYCQASLHEGFGAAVAEAMLYNCIPVVSRRGALPEIAGRWGEYADPEDAADVAAAIQRALKMTTSTEDSPRAHIARAFPRARRRSELLRVVELLSAS